MLASLVVAAVLWDAFDVSGHKRWLAWKAEWEAKGESFNLKALSRRRSRMAKRRQVRFV